MGIKQTGLTLGGLVGALALPPLALVAGWRAALAAGGALALVSAALTLIVYRSPAGTRGASAAAWPGLGETPVLLAPPGAGLGAYALLALGDRLPLAGLVPLALVAGVGAFGWVGLYFALVAEIGGARYAGLLTGVAVAFAWSGVLIGPPVFGLLVDRTGSYAWPWLALAVVGLGVAATLPRPAPLVQREPIR